MRGDLDYAYGFVQKYSSEALSRSGYERTSVVSSVRFVEVQHSFIIPGECSFMLPFILLSKRFQDVSSGNGA